MSSSSPSAQILDCALPANRFAPNVSKIPIRKRASLNVVEPVKIPPQPSIPTKATTGHSQPQDHLETNFRQASNSSHFEELRMIKFNPGKTTSVFIRYKGKEISHYISSRSKSPLIPRLSSTVKVFPSISQLSPGASQKMLQKQKNRPPLNIRNRCQINPMKIDDPMLNRFSLSISSPKTHLSSFRKSSIIEQRHDEQDVLSIFLRNHGGYLDDSEDEAEEEQEAKENSIFTRLSFPFEFRHPNYSWNSSFPSSTSSPSNRSSSNSSANSSFCDSSPRTVPTHLSQLPLEKALSLLSQKYI